MAKLISSQVIKISSVASLRGDMHKYLKIVSPSNHNGIYAYFDQILIAIDKNQIGRAKELCEERLELNPQETDIFICYSIMIAKDTLLNARKLWLEQYEKELLLLQQKAEQELLFSNKKQQEKEILSLQKQQLELSRYSKNNDDDLDFDLNQETILELHAQELKMIAA